MLYNIVYIVLWNKFKSYIFVNYNEYTFEQSRFNINKKITAECNAKRLTREPLDLFSKKI